MSNFFNQGEEFSENYNDSAFHLNAEIISASESFETSFAFLAEEWFRFMTSRLKDSSAAKYLNILRLHLLPKFGVRKITTIQRKELIDFSKSLIQICCDSHKALSSSTVNNILSVTKNIFIYAKTERHLDVADLSGIRVKETSKPLKILSLEDQHKLTTALLIDPTGKNLGILIALYTGIRIGECCALRWKDVSFTNQTIYIHSTLQRIQTNDMAGLKTKVMIMPPKRPSSIRYVPVPNSLYQLMKVQQQEPSDFILSGNKKAVEPRTLEYHFKKVLERCHIDKINFHALRHTFATRCVELGFDIKSLSEILGHANVNITLNRYIHPSMALKQKNMNKLSAFMDFDESNSFSE